MKAYEVVRYQPGEIWRGRPVGRRGRGGPRRLRFFWKLGRALFSLVILPLAVVTMILVLLIRPLLNRIDRAEGWHD